ncbi:MAG TPA: iron ABC transporter permease [Actinomycetota bacterium]|nr:iron ABC transporter permease [Actinomycetota bacterium]
MKRRRGVGTVLAIALVISVILAVGIGTVGISPFDTVRLIGWKLGLTARPDVSRAAEVILFELRLPRVLLATVVGAALAVSGAVFQSLFRNPMADPAIVGVSSGAALGAIVVLLAGGAGVLGNLGLYAAAFAGALATAFLVYRLARIGPAVQVATLLLSGIAVAAVISAVISLVMAFSGEQIRSIYFWLLGGLQARGWEAVGTAAPIVLIGAGGAVAAAGRLNLLTLGDERAAQLGLDVERFKRSMLAAGALLSAAAVAVAGVIGFVGLMTPHILRLVLGADNRKLVPAVVLGGAIFMVLADLAARTVLAPQEIPVGALTALLGGPFFLYLLRRERRVAGARG